MGFELSSEAATRIANLSKAATLITEAQNSGVNFISASKKADEAKDILMQELPGIACDLVLVIDKLKQQ